MRKLREKRVDGGILRQQILPKDAKSVINPAFLSGKFGRDTVTDGEWCNNVEKLNVVLAFQF